MTLAPRRCGPQPTVVGSRRCEAQTASGAAPGTGSTSTWPVATSAVDRRSDTRTSGRASGLLSFGLIPATAQQEDKVAGNFEGCRPASRPQGRCASCHSGTSNSATMLGRRPLRPRHRGSSRSSRFGLAAEPPGTVATAWLRPGDAGRSSPPSPRAQPRNPSC